MPRPSPLYRRDLAIIEKALGEDHPSVGTSLNNLAGLYRGAGPLCRGRATLPALLAIREKALGKDHPTSASRSTTLHRCMGAKPLCRGRAALPAALAITRKGARAKTIRMSATSLNNLAGLYQARPLCRGRAALPARPCNRRKGAGDRPPRCRQLAQQSGRGSIDDKGRYAEAEPLYRRALAIRETALGPNHDSVANSLNNLGQFFADQGRHEEAGICLRRCVAILVAISKQIERDHPYLELAVKNCAKVLSAGGASEPDIKKEIEELKLGQN